MELVGLLRMLWSRRRLVVVGAVVAVAAGILVTRSPTRTFGVASLRVVVDTPTSQTVDVNPAGVYTLLWRATNAANLMGSSDMRERVARSSGIGARDLAVSAPFLAIPAVPTPLPAAAAEAAAAPTKPYQLAIQAADQLPLIKIDALAPTPADARRLAVAASEALAQQFEPTADARGRSFVARAVGPARSSEVRDGPRHLMVVMAASLVFFLWCVGIAAWSAPRGLRSRVPRRPDAAR